MKVIMVVLVAGAVWLALRGLRRVPVFLTLSAEVQARIRSVLPAVSLTVWLLYGVWAVNAIVAADDYARALIVVVVSILLLLFGWFVLKDLVAGIVFAARHPSLQGVQIEAAGVSGRIVETGILGIRLKAEGGETVFLPYASMAGGPFVEYPPERSADEFRVRVAIPGEVNGDGVADELRTRLLLLPWINAERPPVVTVSGNGPARVADVVYHCLNGEHALHVEEFLRRDHGVSEAGGERDSAKP